MPINEKDAKTYADLMWLLPDVSKISIWWRPDPEGPPQFIDRIALFGHDGELLIEARVDDVEEVDTEFEGKDASAYDLRERLPAALMILSWLDASVLDWQGDASVLDLPSASHLGDEPPTDWIAP